MRARSLGLLRTDGRRQAEVSLEAVKANPLAGRLWEAGGRGCFVAPQHWEPPARHQPPAAKATIRAATHPSHQALRRVSRPDRESGRQAANRLARQPLVPTMLDLQRPRQATAEVCRLRSPGNYRHRWPAASAVQENPTAASEVADQWPSRAAGKYLRLPHDRPKRPPV